MRTCALVAGAVLVLAGVAGALVGYISRPDVSTTSEFTTMEHSLQRQLSESRSDLGIAKNDLDAANQRINDISDREAALTAGEARLKTDQAALDEKTRQVQSTQFGDGVHIVGSTVVPGVYSITSSTGCYYVWKTSTGSDAQIIDNNIVNGPAVVTLKPGDIFETSRCGTWTKTG